MAKKIKWLWSLFLLFGLACQSSGATPKIVVIGSSTAAGTGASTPASSWVGLLRPWAWETLGWRVDNLATPGTLTSSATCAIADSALKKAFALGATHLIVSFPSNDATVGIAPKLTLKYWNSIFQCAAENGVKVAAMSTLPRAGLTPDQSKSIAQVDQSLKQILGPCFIDIKNELIAPDGVNPKISLSAGDGVHFNDQGHLVIFNRVTDFLKSKKCF